MNKWLHRAAGAALAIGGFAATTLIPATLVVTVGPVAVPVAAAVSGAIALAAAFGVTASPTVQKILRVAGPTLEQAVGRATARKP
jgi:hypothetical protein